MQNVWIVDLVNLVSPVSSRSSGLLAPPCVRDDVKAAAAKARDSSFVAPKWEVKYCRADVLRQKRRMREKKSHRSTVGSWNNSLNWRKVFKCLNII